MKSPIGDGVGVARNSDSWVPLLLLYERLSLSDSWLSAVSVRRFSNSAFLRRYSLAFLEKQFSVLWVNALGQKLQ